MKEIIICLSCHYNIDLHIWMLSSNWLYFNIIKTLTYLVYIVWPVTPMQQLLLVIFLPNQNGNLSNNMHSHILWVLWCHPNSLYKRKDLPTSTLPLSIFSCASLSAMEGSNIRHPLCAVAALFSSSVIWSKMKELQKL